MHLGFTLNTPQKKTANVSFLTIFNFLTIQNRNVQISLIFMCILVHKQVQNWAERSVQVQVKQSLTALF